MKADCIYARVHVFFLVEKVSCGIKSHVVETYGIVSHVCQAKKQNEWASVADRFKSFAPFRLMGDSKNYLHSF